MDPLASDDGTVKLDLCEACMSTIQELRKRVPQLAKLSETDMKEILADSAPATRLFPIQAFLSRER